LHASNPFLFNPFSKVSINLLKPMALGSITGRVITFLKERPIIKFGFVGTLYPYLIPSEEGDG